MDDVTRPHAAAAKKTGTESDSKFRGESVYFGGQPFFSNPD